jgi:hypothetical protein
VGRHHTRGAQGDPEGRFVTSYEEWRVTAGLTVVEVAKTFRAESEARDYIDQITKIGPLGVGPHLHKRTVTVTDWEEIEP